MARKRIRLVVVLGTLVTLACLAALRAGHDVARVPEDLNDYTGDFLWRPASNTVAFSDGSGRSLTLPSEQTLALHHPSQSTALVLSGTGSALAGVTPDNQAITLRCAVPGPVPPVRRLTLVRQGVAESTAPALTSTVALEPDVERLDDVLLSPDGSQLLWQWTTARDAFGVGLLRRLSPASAARFTPRRQTEIWSSDSHGQHLRLLATAPYTSPTEVVIGWSPRSSVVISHRTRHYQLR